MIIRVIWKILGANGAEDFLYVADNQRVIDHLFCPIQIVKAQEESLKTVLEGMGVL